MNKLLVAQVYWGKLLNPLSDIDLALEEVAVRVKLRDVHPVELSALMAAVTKRTHDLAIGTQNFPNHVVFAIDD